MARKKLQSYVYNQNLYPKACLPQQPCRTQLKKPNLTSRKYEPVGIRCLKGYKSDTETLWLLLYQQLYQDDAGNKLKSSKLEPTMNNFKGAAHPEDISLVKPVESE
ncbi:uncharacterized protein BX664DRAFT_350605 [Halteromyces radiatus]|uniref:uncharacterized protein n=1 Tax=Halteromyces radiatus TaxID=101107 RepID=UPI00222072EF|nr:uncharacterized protein BX664DRAFT_350605 [Halteromyces radiatus]KAI8086187.1 hypothetical protein BX664DRAFT_350605 [Halteromyces radiatus]